MSVARSSKALFTDRGLLTALGASLILMGCGGSGSGGSVHEQADKALQQGNAPLATTLLRGSLQEHPEDVRTRLQLANALAEAGDADGALIEYDKASKAGAKVDAVVPGLARAMLEKQQYRKLLDTHGSTSLQDPAAQLDLETSLAIAHLRSGNRDQAQAMIDKVLKQQPGQFRAAAMAARMAGNTGNFDHGFKILDTAESQPGNDRRPELWMARADLQLYGKHNADAALEGYSKVATQAPTIALAHSNRVQLLLLKKDLPGAEAAQAAMAKALPKHPQTLFTAAVVAAHKKDYARARDLLQPLLRANVSNTEVLALAGSMELELGNVINAVSQLQRVVYQSPQASGPRKALARAQLRQGVPEKALEVLEPLLHGKTPDAEVLSLAAGAHLAAGRIAKAEALYARALAIAPEDSATKTQLALAKLRSSPGEGLAMLQSTADSTKETVADMALIAAQLQRRDFDGAIKSIDKLKAKAPQAAQPSMLLGQVAMLKRDLLEARQQFEAAQAKEPKHVAALLALATLDRIDGKHAQAEARLTEFLKKEPRAVPVSLALAEVLQQRSAPATSIVSLYGSTIAGNPSDASARLALLKFHLRRNDIKALLEAAQAARAALPNDLAILSMLGNAQMLSGDVQQGLSTFQKLVAQAPDNPKGYVQLAQLEAVAGRTAQAEASFRKALSLDSNNVDANRGLIALGMKIKRPELSLNAAKAIQKGQPDDGLGHMLEGDILLRMNKIDAALEAYRAGLTRKQPLALPSRIYTVLKMRKNDAQAQQFADDWLRQHGQDLNFRFFLGNQAIAEGQWTQAEAQFTEVNKIAPQLPSALNNLAWLKIKQGKPGAMALAEKALAQAPDFPALLDTLAQAQMAEGQASKAGDTAKLAVSKAPEVAGYQVTLAQALLKSGNKAAAAAALAEAEKLKPDPALAKEIAELRKQAG